MLTRRAAVHRPHRAGDRRQGDDRDARAADRRSGRRCRRSGARGAHRAREAAGRPVRHRGRVRRGAGPARWFRARRPRCDAGAAARLAERRRGPVRRCLLRGALASRHRRVWGWAPRRCTEPRAGLALYPRARAGSRGGLSGGGIATYLAISPDGGTWSTPRARGGGWALDIRRLDQLQAPTLPGTEGATYPEFSPDGRWIAFGAADGSLRKIAVDGTELTTLAPLDAGGINGLTWTSDREIVFARLNLALPGTLAGAGPTAGEPIRFSQFDSASGSGSRSPAACGRRWPACILRQHPVQQPRPQDRRGADWRRDAEGVHRAGWRSRPLGLPMGCCSTCARRRADGGALRPAHAGGGPAAPGAGQHRGQRSGPRLRPCRPRDRSSTSAAACEPAGAGGHRGARASSAGFRAGVHLIPRLSPDGRRLAVEIAGRGSERDLDRRFRRRHRSSA